MLWDNDKWAQALLMISASAGQLWKMVSEAAVQAITHYHDHSYDSTRVRQLYETLEQAKLGTHLTCLSHVINKATGIRIGEWKHSSKKLENQAELWQDVLARVESQGLESFKVVRETTDKEKVKQDKAQTSVKVATPEVKAALQKAVDSKAFQALPPEVQTARIRALETGGAGGFDLITDPQVRAKLEEYALHLQQAIEAGHAKVALDSLDAGIGKMTRHLKNSISEGVKEIKDAARAAA
jgi:hypothetical protein